MKHNQKGFSVVEAIIILLVIAAIGFAGWFVWQSKHKSSDASKKASSGESSKSEKSKAADPTDGWVRYSNAEGDFSFKHPASWVFAANPEQCNPGLALFASNAATLGKCATESFGQMNVMSVAGDERANFDLEEAYYTDVTEEAVTVAAVVGTKLTGTVSGMEAEVVVGGWPDNTKLVRYVFFTAGRTYVASYIQEPTFPDVLSDFNLLVTSTLQFSE